MIIGQSYLGRLGLTHRCPSGIWRRGAGRRILEKSNRRGRWRFANKTCRSRTAENATARRSAGISLLVAAVCAPRSIARSAAAGRGPHTHRRKAVRVHLSSEPAAAILATHCTQLRALNIRSQLVGAAQYPTRCRLCLPREMPHHASEPRLGVRRNASLSLADYSG
jgi:hypothetical protein